MAMLVQFTALLSLGVLCSSAPLQPSRPSAHNEHYSFVETVIQEILEDLNRTVLEVPSIEAVNATLERCMHSHLKTFAAALEPINKYLAIKLKLVRSYNSILPKDLDEACTTLQVSSKVFLETLKNFLRLLNEKIRNA